MEDFIACADAAKGVKRKRQTFDNEFIAKAVTLTRQVGATAAVAHLNIERTSEDFVKVATLDNWLHRWRKEGEFWKQPPSKRGRRDIMDAVPGAKEE